VFAFVSAKQKALSDVNQEELQDSEWCLH